MKGATLDIQELTGWQARTVRSILGKKSAYKIESSKKADGERTYRITK